VPHFNNLVLVSWVDRYLVPVPVLLLMEESASGLCYSVKVSQRAVAKIIQVFDHLLQRNEKVMSLDFENLFPMLILTTVWHGCTGNTTLPSPRVSFGGKAKTGKTQKRKM
jgi:hypothetical protein